MNRLFLISLLLLSGACSRPADSEQTPIPAESSSATTAKPAASASYQQAHAAAVAAIQTAADKGHAWSTSDALLKQAQSAAADGDTDRAIQLADAARVQGELASRQADTEAAAWRERVLSN